MKKLMMLMVLCLATVLVEAKSYSSGSRSFSSGSRSFSSGSRSSSGWSSHSSRTTTAPKFTPSKPASSSSSSGWGSHSPAKSVSPVKPNYTAKPAIPSAPKVSPPKPTPTPSVSKSTWGSSGVTKSSTATKSHWWSSKPSTAPKPATYTSVGPQVTHHYHHSDGSSSFFSPFNMFLMYSLLNNRSSAPVSYGSGLGMSGATYNPDAAKSMSYAVEKPKHSRSGATNIWYLVGLGLAVFVIILAIATYLRLR